MYHVYAPPDRPWYVTLTAMGAYVVIADPGYRQALARHFGQSPDYVVEIALRVLDDGRPARLTAYW